MYTLSEYKDLVLKYGSYSSWAIWNPTNSRDTTIIDQNYNELNARHILLGLNISGPLTKGPWANFHDNTHARKIRYACNDTELRGSYITDIFKNIEEPKSAKFKNLLTNQMIEENVKFFIQEMSDIKLNQDSILIVFGSPGSLTAKCFNNYFREYFKNQVVFYYHYSYYKLTDKAWVTGFWNLVGIHENYDLTVGKYKREKNLE